MSSTTKIHSSLTLSTSSSSASIHRQSYPTAARQDRTHAHTRNVHSAPATFAQQPSSKQGSDLTLSSTSTEYASDDSTVIASSTSSNDTPPPKSNSKRNAKSTQLSAEDDLWATQTNAELAVKAEARAHEEVARARAKAKRGCMGAIADEFDFGYANVPSRQSKHGRKAVGGSGLGKCELM